MQFFRSSSKMKANLSGGVKTHMSPFQNWNEFLKKLKFDFNFCKDFFMKNSFFHITICVIHASCEKDYIFFLKSNSILAYRLVLMRKVNLTSKTFCLILLLQISFKMKKKFTTDKRSLMQSSAYKMIPFACTIFFSYQMLKMVLKSVIKAYKQAKCISNF